MGSVGDGGKVDLFKNNLFPIHHPEIFVINPICYAETINHLGGDGRRENATTKGGAIPTRRAPQPRVGRSRERELLHNVHGCDDP